MLFYYTKRQRDKAKDEATKKLSHIINNIYTLDMKKIYIDYIIDQVKEAHDILMKTNTRKEFIIAYENWLKYTDLQYTKDVVYIHELMKERWL